jgi:HlyD family secretion protein
MKRRQVGWVFAVAALLALGSTGVYYANRSDNDGLEITTVPVSRDDLVESVRAVGTIEAMTTVQVGAQVTGIVQSLHADFNSIVHKGDLLAQIDPSALEAQAAQMRAGVTRAAAEVERLRVLLADAEARLGRTRALFAQRLVAPADLDTADIARRLAQAQVETATAQVKQARASLCQIETSIERTAIRSPIDGIVISRDVDVGQTVSSRLQAPILFRVAADLSKMRIVANVDEADIARVRRGQPVTFFVDAFGEDFDGRVTQVRVQPTLTQNAVTYGVIIDVANPRLELRPGMTATLTIETARHDDVLRVPNAALLFRPSSEMFTALNEPAPPLRGPRPAGRVWVMRESRLLPVQLQIGSTDGTYTELRSGPLGEGAEIVTAITTAAQRKAPAPLNNPLFGPQRRWGHFH